MCKNLPFLVLTQNSFLAGSNQLGSAVRHICISLLVLISYEISAQSVHIKFQLEQDSLLDIAYQHLDIRLTGRVNENVEEWFSNLSSADKKNALDFMQRIKYNSACIYSLSEDSKLALAHLEEAIDFGYLDFEQFATDSDLKNLRRTPSYDRLIEAYGKDVSLNSFAREQLFFDYDLLISSMKEAHPGLHWYTNYVQLDSIIRKQRNLLREGQHVLDFYKIAAKVVESAKEGHFEIKLGLEAKNWLYSQGRFLPVCTKYLDEKLYALNEINGEKGLQIVSINDREVRELTQELFSIIPSDGFNETLKYEWLNNGQFAWFFSILYPDIKEATLKLYDPKSGNTYLKKVDVVGFAKLQSICLEAGMPFTRLDESYPNSFVLLNEHTALLSLPDFYNDPPEEFHRFVDSIFAEVKAKSIKNLIVDVRRNEGGYEGYEDYVFSYLTNKPYKKYRYVEGSGFHYSFYKHTHLNNEERIRNFANALHKELYTDVDGRILRKPDFMPPEPVREDAFTGRLYILTGGLTYSGGAEFASIVKAHREATFIGVETGGGYYGQTSGFFLILTLPNTQTVVRIPLLKFSVNEKTDDIPYGRGVLPDHVVQPTIQEYLQGYDAELEFTKTLIQDEQDGSK